jgi:hypothetical protein
MEPGSARRPPWRAAAPLLAAVLAAVLVLGVAVARHSGDLQRDAVAAGPAPPSPATRSPNHTPAPAPAPAAGPTPRGPAGPAPLAAAPGAPGPAAAGEVARVRIRVPAGRPLRVLVVGDSVAFTLRDAFDRAAERLSTSGVRTELLGVMAQPGFGLTADSPGRLDWSGVDPSLMVPPAQWFAGWPLRLADTIGRDRPDVVVVLVGAWDAIPRRVDGAWLRPGTRRWRVWFERRVALTNEILGHSGAAVVWLRLSCLGDEHQSGRLAAVSGVIADAARRRPRRVATFDLDPVVCPDGRYDALFRHGGEVVKLRMDDGVHFQITSAGAALAPVIADQLKTLLADA